MPIKKHHPHPQVTNNKRHIALSRGPLLYCLERHDHKNNPMEHDKIARNTQINSRYEPETLDGVTILETLSTAGQPLHFIPYYAWGNRGPSKMRVWIREES